MFRPITVGDNTENSPDSGDAIPNGISNLTNRRVLFLAKDDQLRDLMQLGVDTGGTISQLKSIDS